MTRTKTKAGTGTGTETGAGTGTEGGAQCGAAAGIWWVLQILTPGTKTALVYKVVSINI